jgi:polar amino acid transport system substrate-binding protein
MWRYGYRANARHMAQCTRFIKPNAVWIVVLAAVIFASAPREALTQNLVNSTRELVIATKEAPPFVIKRKDGSWSGISIELWRRIAG